MFGSTKVTIPILVSRQKGNGQWLISSKIVDGESVINLLANPSNLHFDHTIDHPANYAQDFAETNRIDIVVFGDTRGDGNIK